MPRGTFLAPLARARKLDARMRANWERLEALPRSPRAVQAATRA